MNKKYYIALFVVLFVCGCASRCPDGYTPYDNKCYKYDNVDALITYYCNRGGELQNSKCIVTEEYNCSRTSDKEICTTQYEYLAAKEYNCPKGYTLNGEKCSKIKYYK